jgi:hypothetical protein
MFVLCGYVSALSGMLSGSLLSAPPEISSAGVKKLRLKSLLADLL